MYRATGDAICCIPVRVDIYANGGNIIVEVRTKVYVSSWRMHRAAGCR